MSIVRIGNKYIKVGKDYNNDFYYNDVEREEASRLIDHCAINLYNYFTKFHNDVVIENV